MLAPGQERFVSQQRVGHLATVDEGGQPHVVPVCFAYVGGKFYIPVDLKPKKGKGLKRLRNIASNPKVALLFHVYEEDWTRLRWIMVQGLAEMVGEGADYFQALEALTRRYPQYRGLPLVGRPLICISPQRVLEWQWS